MTPETSLPNAIFLMGPTASGKTELAIQLVEKLNCEIISVDSALIYRDMDIGTAKPSAEEQSRAPHRLVDILDPSESYSVAEFRRDALKQMKEICQSGKTPLLVGGTMMYYKALVEGLSPLPESDAGVRAQIQLQAKIRGWQALHNELASFDPISAQRIHPNDPQRLMRALEVKTLTGESMSEILQRKSQPIPYNLLQFAIAPKDRKRLHQRIESRFQQMLASGFQREVEILRNRGDLHLDLPSMRCVGYRQMWQYLDGEYDFSTMQAKGMAATRQLAKRQLTWLRSWPQLTWLDTFATDSVDKIIYQISCSDQP